MDPFISELKLAAFNFAPRGWSLANGQLLAINSNQALFSLLGTTFGGNGTTNFALPNLQGRVPIHVGSGFSLGQIGGEASHNLTLSEIPSHTHTLQGINATQNSGNPANGFLANTSSAIYSPPAGLIAMFPGDISNTGGSLPHPNQSPYLVMNWIIALQGIYPSQN